MEPLKWDDLEEYEEWDPSKSSFLVHAVAGSFAGASEHCMMYPFDTIKTYAQAEGAVQSGVSSVVGREGIFRLWRGVSTMLTASVPAHAAYFSIYEVVKETLGGNTESHAPIAAACSGMTATLAHDFIMTPMDVVKQRLQLGFHSGTLDCIRTVIKQEGIRSLFLSFPTTLLMNVPYAAITVATNESLKKLTNPKGEYNLWAFLLSGAGAGATASAFTTPLDVVKTRLQTQSLIHKTPAIPPPLAEKSQFGLMQLRYHYSSSHKKSQYVNNSMGPCIGTYKKSRFANILNGGKVRKFYRMHKVEHKYNGLVDAIERIYRTEGLAGFSRGLRPRLMVHTPSVAISWAAYETAKDSLTKLQY